MRQRLATLVLLLLTGMHPAAAAQDVQDLAYGEALFHFYQDDYFTSGVHLLAAIDRRQLPHHQTDGELLLGGLQLYFGMHAQARRTLEKLLPGNVAPAQRDLVWFQLAKLAYQRGDLPEANDALAHLSGHLAEEVAAEARQLAGLVALAQGDQQRALTALADTKAPPPWDIYLGFDRAIALLRNGQADAALAEFDRLGTRDARNEEEATLRDRANLAGGYAALRVAQPGRARPFFQRIRLRGDSAHMALLGAGWAAIGDDAGSDALAPWTALAAEPPHDDAVLEGLLALPYAYAQLGDQAQAAQHYRQAIASYRDERARLTAVRREVEAGALPATLEAQDRPGLASRLQGVDVPLESPVTNYLPQLLARHDFQGALKDYLDLRQLQDNLEQWAGSLSAFDTMLDARRARYAQVLPRIDARLARIDLQALEQRRAALEQRLHTLRAEQDVWEVAEPHERDLHAVVQRLIRRVEGLPASQLQLNYLERLYRLRGVQYWQAHAAFPQRLWERTKLVKALDAPLAETRTRHQTLQGAHRHADSRIAGLGERIAAQRTRVGQLRPRLESALAAQAARLERLALLALDERDRLLDSYLLQAQFALARVYDQAQIVEDTP